MHRTAASDADDDGAAHRGARRKRLRCNQLRDALRNGVDVARARRDIKHLSLVDVDEAARLGEGVDRLNLLVARHAAHLCTARAQQVLAANTGPRCDAEPSFWAWRRRRRRRRREK